MTLKEQAQEAANRCNYPIYLFEYEGEMVYNALKPLEGEYETVYPIKPVDKFDKALWEFFTSPLDE